MQGSAHLFIFPSTRPPRALIFLPCAHQTPMPTIPSNHLMPNDYPTHQRTLLEDCCIGLLAVSPPAGDLQNRLLVKCMPLGNRCVFKSRRAGSGAQQSQRHQAPEVTISQYFFFFQDWTQTGQRISSFRGTPNIVPIDPPPPPGIVQKKLDHGERHSVFVQICLWLFPILHSFHF